MLEEQRFEFCDEKRLSDLGLQSSRARQDIPDVVELPTMTAGEMSSTSAKENKDEDTKMVYCTFSGIKEQTTADERACNMPARIQDRRKMEQAKDMRCFYKDSRLTVITRGGLKYVNNLRLQIDEVFPLEDGLLIRALFNSDLISFELGANPPTFIRSKTNAAGAHGSKPGVSLNSTERTFVYLSLLEHPLNEAYPANIRPFQSPHSNLTESQHVNTELQVFSVSPTLPICLVYEPEKKATRFCLICRHKGKTGDSLDSFNASANYFRDQLNAGISFNSSQQQPHHPGAHAGYGQLTQIFGPNQVAIVTLFETETASETPPDKVHICRGLASSEELTISLFFKDSRQVHIYAANVTSSESDLGFERKRIVTGVDAMESIDYSNSTGITGQVRNSVKLVSKTFLKRMQNLSKSIDQQSSTSLAKEQTYFVKRLSQLRGDTILLKGQDLTLLSGGYTEIRTIETAKVLQSIQVVPMSPVVDISDPCGANIQLKMADGTQRRVTLKHSITDFTVRSILKVIKRIVPAKVYMDLQRDLVQLFSSCSKSASKTSVPADQFEKVGNFLLSLLTAKDSTLLTRQGAELARQLQSRTTVMQSQASATNQWQSQGVKTVQASSRRTGLASAGGSSATTDIVAARRRISLAQGGTQSSVTKKTGSKTTGVKKAATVQVEMVAGSVPNAFDLMMQSQFSMDFMSDNPRMLGTELKEQALGSAFIQSSKQEVTTKTLKKPAAYKKEASPLKMSSPMKMMASPIKLSSPMKISSQSSALKRQTRSGAKPQATSKVELAKKKEAVNKAQQATSYLVTVETLQPYAAELFEALHLLYEDVKLDRLRFAVEGKKLRRFLLVWILEDGSKSVPKTAFVSYYLVESDMSDPLLRRIFAQELASHAEHVQAAATNEVELSQVPRIFDWVEQLLSDGGAVNEFPVFYEQTRVVCRLMQVLFHKEASYFVRGLRDQVPTNKEDSVMEGDSSALRSILISRNSALYMTLNRTDFTVNTQDYLMLKRQASFGSDPHLFERVLYTLKEEQIGIDEIQSWPTMVGLPLFEVIRYTRLHLQDIQTMPWPVSLYKLVHREDIINNLMQVDVAQNAGGSVNANDRAGKQRKQSQGRQLVRNQSVEIRKAQFRKRKSSGFALNHHESNVFSALEAEQMGFAAQIIDDELQQTKMQDAIVQELIGGEEEQQDKQPVGISGKGFQGSNLSSSNQMNDFIKNKFGRDTRYKEVEHMLSSHHNMNIKINAFLGGANQGDAQAVNEAERQRQVKAQLEKVFRRHLSKCTGRGALTLGTQETIPTETLEIPKICQTGQISNASQNELDEAAVASSTINLELTREEKEVLSWPSFHNGAASALRIAQSCFKRNQSSAKSQQSGGQQQSQSSSSLNQTRNWIMYHKPQEPKFEHGGFLLGVGLLGQLDSLQAPDLYQHLKSAHDQTTIGILLGRAASQIGKMDDQDTRMMCLHVPALLPQNLLVDISLPVQSAAVVSAGMLYQGTQNRLISEMLIAQIARKPTSDKMIEREGYALASGIALGLVNLASSINSNTNGGESENLHSILGIQRPTTQNAQIQDLQLDERLIRFIEGGEVMPLPRSMISNAQQHEGNCSSAIKENNMVNVYVTGSAGLMALTLTHLKSNNGDIASRLVIPQTFYDMEFVMPQILLQKVLCKNLILWDSIQCTKEWLDSQIPSLVKEIFEADHATVQKKYSQRVKLDEIDFATVALCYVNIITGAVSSIGFKFAGTGSESAKTLILSQIEFLRKKLKVVPGTQPCGGPILTNTTPETKNQVDKSTVETCLCVLAYALGLVMAGTCDTDCFRVLRILRKRLEGEMHYGYNMAVNMAIGFLFLGSGAYTFSRSEKAIAALLISTYPILPSSASDNRFHLQALRHFYVLAIETRLLQAKDIDTGRFVNIEVSVKVRDESTGQVSTVRQQTPNIINGQIIEIEVVNHNEYHDVCLQVSSMPDSEDQRMDVDQQSKASNARADGRFEQSALQQVIYVKRKTYQEGEGQSTVKNQVAVTSVAHLLTTGVSVKDLKVRATAAIKKLLLVKDISIQAFIRAFVGRVKEATDVEEALMQRFEQSIALQTSLIQMPSDQQNSYLKRKKSRHHVQTKLIESLREAAIKKQLLALIALEECYVQDKVTALPLFLKVFEKALGGAQVASEVGSSMHLVQAYGRFMARAATQFPFLNVSPQILPPEIAYTNTDSSLTTELDFALLRDYISTNTTSFLRVSSVGGGLISKTESTKMVKIASLLDPSTVQFVKAAIMGAHAQLSQLGAALDQTQTMNMLRQIVNECLLSAKPELKENANIVDCIIEATLNPDSK